MVRLKVLRLEQVHAIKIDDKHIYYDCQYCNRTHIHGNEGEVHNRTHHRGTHCQSEKAPSDLLILVDDKTLRNFKDK